MALFLKCLSLMQKMTSKYYQIQLIQKVFWFAWVEIWIKVEIYHCWWQFERLLIHKNMFLIIHTSTNSFCPLCIKVTRMSLKSYLERYEMSKCQKVLFVFKHTEVIGQFLSETSVSSQIKLHASYIRQFKKSFWIGWLNET